jgi:peptidoglycan/xylan/chitin deacetylase (PgdA/CDA1 family)
MNAPKKWLTALLWHAGITEAAIRRLPTGARFVLVMHGVASRRYPEIAGGAQPSHTQEELAETLTWLSTRFTFLTPEQFLAADRGGVLLTFDDGLANNYEHALPVLEQFAVPAIFFVTTRHIRRPTDWLPATHMIAQRHWADQNVVPEQYAREFYDGMSEEQLQACASHPLITIGGHTESHPFLTQCDSAELEHELTASRSYLQQLTGQPIDTFAYPTGDYDRRVAQATMAAGYRWAFVVDSRHVGLPNYEIPRVGLYQSDSPYLGLKLSGWYRRPLDARG